MIKKNEKKRINETILENILLFTTALIHVGMTTKQD